MTRTPPKITCSAECRITKPFKLSPLTKAIITPHGMLLFIKSNCLADSKDYPFLSIILGLASQLRMI